MNPKAREKQALLRGAYLMGCFVAFTLLLTVMDKRPVGPLGSYVGLATVNAWFHGLTGVHRFFYVFTKVLGYLSILVAAGFIAFTAMQFVRRGFDVRKVDQKLMLLMALYAATFLCYVLFEIVEINARPVLTDGRLEASYPSTHTLLAVCIFGSLPPQLGRFFKGKKEILLYVRIGIDVLLAVTVLGRLICGWHWLTDVIGGVLLAASLLFFYHAMLLRIGSRKKKKERKGKGRPLAEEEEE